MQSNTTSLHDKNYFDDVLNDHNVLEQNNTFQQKLQINYNNHAMNTNTNMIGDLNSPTDSINSALDFVCDFIDETQHKWI